MNKHAYIETLVEKLRFAIINHYMNVGRNTLQDAYESSNKIYQPVQDIITDNINKHEQQCYKSTQMLTKYVLFNKEDLIKKIYAISMKCFLEQSIHTIHGGMEERIYQYLYAHCKTREEHTLFPDRLCNIIKHNVEKYFNNSNNQESYADTAKKDIESIKYLSDFFSFAKQEELNERIFKIYGEIQKIKDKIYLHSVDELSMFDYLYNMITGLTYEQRMQKSISRCTDYIKKNILDDKFKEKKNNRKRRENHLDIIQAKQAF